MPEALTRVATWRHVVCAGIHMSDIPSFPYRLLWQERDVRSVPNLTRDDAREFLAVASTMPFTTHVQTYPLGDANRALDDLPIRPPLGCRGSRSVNAADRSLIQCGYRWAPACDGGIGNGTRFTTGGIDRR